MLQVRGSSYTIHKTDISYKFSVRLGNQEWEIEKVYKDFQKLAADLTAKYGAASLPTLTGTVYLRVLSDVTGQKRLPKFEDYITSILSTWKAAFKNPKFYEIPNPRGRKFPNVLIETTMAEFLDVGENYEPDEEGGKHAKSDNDIDDDDNDEKKVKHNDDADDVDNDDERHTHNAAKRAKDGTSQDNDDEANKKTQPQKRRPSATRLGWSDNDEDNDERQRQRSPNKQSKSANPSSSSTSPRNNNKSSPATNNPKNSNDLNRNNNDDDNNNENDHHHHEAADDFDVIDEAKDTFEAAHVLNQCRTMTGEVDVIVKDYVIHPSAYIEYNFQVTFCGHAWQVTKRFSEFATFFQSLVGHLKGTEYESYVPPIDDVSFGSWRKCDPDVAETRSVWLTNFFKIIAPMMDEWFPVGFLTHFKIRRRQGDEENDDDELDRYASNTWIKVAVNRLLFEWFNFADHVNDFNASDAEKVARENEKLLPQFMQKNLEAVRKEEERVQREKNLAYRRTFMEQLSDFEFQDLIRIISSFDDDRHCLALLEFFVKNGYYYPGKSRVERIQELDSQKAILEKRRRDVAALAMEGTTSSTSLQDSSASSAVGRWGVVRRRMQSLSPAVAFPSFGPQSSTTNFNNNNNNSFLVSSSSESLGPSNSLPQHQQQVGTYSPVTSGNRNQLQGEIDDVDNENVTMDIFDRMQNSAIFGSSTTSKDFASLVTAAVNAAKGQLRGRTKMNAAAIHSQQLLSLSSGAGGSGGDSIPDRAKLSRPCGLTSKQMARVAEAIPFNDTRAAAIAVMSPLLLDANDLAAVFDTLIYDWESAEKTLIELLTKKEAPENFKFTPPPAQMTS